MCCGEAPNLSAILLDSRGPLCTDKVTQKSGLCLQPREQSLGSPLPLTFQYVPITVKPVIIIPSVSLFSFYSTWNILFFFPAW